MMLLNRPKRLLLDSRSLLKERERDREKLRENAWGLERNGQIELFLAFLQFFSSCRTLSDHENKVQSRIDILGPYSCLLNDLAVSFDK